jgi:hypothetical protein
MFNIHINTAHLSGIVIITKTALFAGYIYKEKGHENKNNCSHYIRCF